MCSFLFCLMRGFWYVLGAFSWAVLCVVFMPGARFASPARFARVARFACLVGATSDVANGGSMAGHISVGKAMCGVDTLFHQRWG